MFQKFNLAVFILIVLFRSSSFASTTRTIIDSRGIEVNIPVNIQRVATISDGLIEGIMTALGVQDKLVAVGSSCIQRNFQYIFPSVDGTEHTYTDGMNPVLYLNPWIKNLPRISQSRSPINYEVLVKTNPDVVLARIGSCTLRHIDDETAQKSIEILEAIGIPVIVLYGTTCYETPFVSGITNEISIIGNVFNNPKRAKQLSDYLETQIQFIKDRTNGIKESDKENAIIFGLSPRARKAGGAGQIFGLDTIESFFIETIANAKNAYREPGYFKTINTEQILHIDPDVIVLCTAYGYHPPKELYNALYYRNLQDLKAVKNKRIAALPWSPCNCSKRLEYPIDAMVIATASYPDIFKDIPLADRLLDFYKNVYGVDNETAKKLRSVQWMDWTLEKK